MKSEADALRGQLADLKLVFDAILESTQAGYWDWYIQKNEEYMSPAFKAMLGYDDHEVPNNPEWWQKNVHPDDLPMILEAFNKHVATKGEYPFDNEVRYYHKNGSIVWVFCRGKVIEWDAEGKPIRMVGSHVDITESKLAQVQLAHTLEVSKTGVWEWDVLKKELVWDKQTHSLFGIDKNQKHTSYQTWLSYLHPEDAVRAAQEVTDALKGIKNYDTVYRIHTPKGETRFIKAKGNVVLGVDSKPIKLIGMSWDVTGEQLALAALKDNEERFQLAVAGSSAGLWDWKDMSKDEVWWSPRASELLGYGINEMPSGRSDFRALIHPEDIDLGTEGLQRHVNGEKFELEYRLQCKSGEYKWFRLNGQALFDEKGEPKRMVGTLLDINEKRKAEEALVEKKARFKLAVQGSSAGIWDWKDINSGEEWWSPKFYELLGFEDQEMPATVDNFSKLLHPDDVKPTFDLVDRHFKKEGVFEIEYRLKTKLGDYKWYLGSGQAEWDENGKPKRMVGSIVDIDDRKKAEKLAQLKTEQLVQKNKEMEEFVFVASHDLQEPVRTLSGFVDLFIDSYANILDEDGIKCLGFMKGATERSQDLIKDLLDYSRLGAKKEPAYIDLNKTVEDAQADLYSIIKEKSAKIESANLPHIIGLETEMRLLFQNLIGNAIKFSKTSELPHVKISCEEKEDQWLFKVEDNGIGFDPKHSVDVFVIFKQLNRRNEYKGTGIGLAQCKRIVELHQGKIWAESQEGKGSTFYFMIPTQPAKQI